MAFRRAAAAAPSSSCCRARLASARPRWCSRCVRRCGSSTATSSPESSTSCSATCRSAPSSSALQDLVRQLLTESQAQTRAWRDAIVGAVGRNGRVITEVIPALERIIGPQPPLAALEPTESQNRFNHVFQNFLQVFCREDRPLVVFLDDMQWADPASLRLLTSLLSAAGTHSLLVIASCRDNEVVATHPFMLAHQGAGTAHRAGPHRAGGIRSAGPTSRSSSVTPSTWTAMRPRRSPRPFARRPAAIRFSCGSSCRSCRPKTCSTFDVTPAARSAATSAGSQPGDHRERRRPDRAENRPPRPGDAARGFVRRRDRQSLRSRHSRERGRVHAGTGARAAGAGAAREPAARTGRRRGSPAQYTFQHDRVQQAAYALVPPPRARLSISPSDARCSRPPATTSRDSCSRSSIT